MPQISKSEAPDPGISTYTSPLFFAAPLQKETLALVNPTWTAYGIVTMAFLKTGLYLNEGPCRCGEVHVAEISIPSFLAEHSSTLLIDKEFAAEHFILREQASAKHTNGKVLIKAKKL